MRNARFPQNHDSGSECRGSFRVRLAWGRKHRVFAFVAVCWLFSVAAPRAFLLQGQSAEYPVKLGFLYNFTKFVQWPPDSYASPGAPLVICVVGRDPFPPDMKSQLRTQIVSGHPVQLKTLKSNDRLSGCHLVFIPGTDRVQQEKLVRLLIGSSILTVGESEGFTALGGIINLKLERDQLRFEVNRGAADRAHLKISSHLLTLARIVE